MGSQTSTRFYGFGTSVQKILGGNKRAGSSPQLGKRPRVLESFRAYANDSGEAFKKGDPFINASTDWTYSIHVHVPHGDRRSASDDGEACGKKRPKLARI
jgi:hypothetical protein